jgi:exosortase
MNSVRPSSWFTLTATALLCLLVTTLLLALQYSYGVGTETYSLARYIWTSWNEGEDMGHGFLVVPAVLFLIYEKREKLLSLEPVCGSWGLLLLIPALMLYWAGHQADVTFVGLVSVMFVLAGTVWWILGWGFLKELAFPIGFLAFAIPFPGLDMMVALPLRFLMSKLSVIFLNLMGVPVILSGTGILSAPDAVQHLAAGQRFAVDVANPCSGIRSLLALMMIGALYAHFTLRSLWKQWLLFLCTPLLAVAGNLVRILMLTLGTVAFGSEFALGKNPLSEPSWFHLAAGYLVFLVAFGGMLGISSFLKGMGRRSPNI